AKTELNARLDKLADNLNKTLHKQNYEGSDYSKWLETHQPFHWFAEFYEIINDRNGFDVVIGNPPYVEYSKVRDIYRINDYKTEKCGNLYAYVFERCFKISKYASGLIIQLSAISTETMKPLQEFLKNNSKNIYSSCFPERPKQLFDGACIALTIQICFKLGNEKVINSGGINRTTEQAREYLFQNLTYTKIENEFIPKQHLFPKFKISIEKSIFSKIIKEKQLLNYISNNSGSNNSIFYRTAGGRYWKIFLNRNFKNESTSNKSKSFDKKYDKNTIVAVLNSNLFWWYFANYFDLYNLKDYMIFSFPFSFKNDSEDIGKLGLKLMKSFERNVETKEQYIQSKSQTTYFETFNPASSKDIIDEIDIALAKHYGFTAEEVDFVINYDIKYRMGKELENGEDE
nr:Eco57I restriction-modification methylase domain-containing protein [Candidatus Kapabacteria bacterium]